MYNLPSNYTSRPKPEYFNDTLEQAHLWQADVYKLAASLAKANGIHRIVDIGCGRATKLLPLHTDFGIVGIDYGSNIDHLRENYPVGEWIEADLEHEIIPADLFEGSVVICADVIEHLIDPMPLVETLKNAIQSGAYVLLSTPDRWRMYGREQMGPPSNLAHVREWTLEELAHWIRGEAIPIIWAGWTVSFANQPDRLNTSLLVLFNNPNRIETSGNFEEGLTWVFPKTSQYTITGLKQTADLEPPPNLLKVWMTPTPREAALDTTNSINQIVTRINPYMTEFGVQFVEEPSQATIFAGHAGQGSQSPIHVAHYHGLYPTAQGSDNFIINRSVIRNLKTAYVITAPSQWIADVIRRDMHVEPRVIGWGVDVDEWAPLPSHANYVIWNKARVDNVSDPGPMLALAAMAHDVLFLTTFGIGTPNVKAIGRQPYDVMKNYVRNALVYLSTNVETFGIGIMEALAAGVPVLAYRQGAQAEYIQHGVHGFLAEPGDLEGLYKGLQYCIQYRKELGANGRELAKQFTWRKVAQDFAAIYHEVATMRADVRPHRIDPSLYLINSF